MCEPSHAAQSRKASRHSARWQGAACCTTRRSAESSATVPLLPPASDVVTLGGTAPGTHAQRPASAAAQRAKIVASRSIAGLLQAAGARLRAWARETVGC